MNFKLLMVIAWLNPLTGNYELHREFPAIEWWPPGVHFPRGRPLISREDCLALSRWKMEEYRDDGGRVTYVDCVDMAKRPE
jgi:hypothetical protein|tara:strand:- start:1256 stop:1498 length:243 start_codon:yes stop_codon:yes gene_type:complete